jgi:hypothetical protein
MRRPPSPSFAWRNLLEGFIVRVLRHAENAIVVEHCETLDSGQCFGCDDLEAAGAGKAQAAGDHPDKLLVRVAPLLFAKATLNDLAAADGNSSDGVLGPGDEGIVGTIKSAHRSKAGIKQSQNGLTNVRWQGGPRADQSRKIAEGRRIARRIILRDAVRR